MNYILIVCAKVVLGVWVETRMLKDESAGGLDMDALPVDDKGRLKLLEPDKYCLVEDECGTEKIQGYKTSGGVVFMPFIFKKNELETDCKFGTTVHMVPHADSLEPNAVCDLMNDPQFDAVPRGSSWQFTCSDGCSSRNRMGTCRQPLCEWDEVEGVCHSNSLCNPSTKWDECIVEGCTVTPTEVGPRCIEYQEDEDVDEKNLVYCYQKKVTPKCQVNEMDSECEPSVAGLVRYVLQKEEEDEDEAKGIFIDVQGHPTIVKTTGCFGVPGYINGTRCYEEEDPDTNILKGEVPNPFKMVIHGEISPAKGSMFVQDSSLDKLVIKPVEIQEVEVKSKYRRPLPVSWSIMDDELTS